MNAADRYLETHVLPKLGRVSMQFALLCAAVLIAGLLSATIVGRDTNWDLVNYHFYNPWALLHGRMGWDIAPAQLQSYLSPLLDLPFYYMVTWGWPGRAIAFAMAVPAGIGAYFLARVLARFFETEAPATRAILVVLAFAIGITATSPVAMLGSTMNEWPGAMLIMAAIWCALPSQAAPSTPRRAAAAGVLAGVACALKLTCVPFAIGIAAAIAASGNAPRSWKDAGLYTALALIGFIAVDGFWLWKLYALYDSPLFPFFNQWFGSPWFEPHSVAGRVFGPKTMWQWVTFPLPLFGRTEMYVSEPAIRDWRLPMVYVLGIASTVAWFARRRFRLVAPVPASRPDGAQFVLVFFAVACVLWAAEFSVYRYIVVLDLLSGAVLLYLVSTLVARESLRVAALATSVLVIFNVVYPGWGHLPFDGPFIQVKMPTIEPHTLVLLTNAEPIGYVLPYFPEDGRFVGINNNLNNPGRHDLMQDQISHVVGSHRGPIVAIAYPVGSDMRALRDYHLRRKSNACRQIVTNMATSPIDVCDVERDGTAP
jgi:hypothetical protein